MLRDGLGVRLAELTKLWRLNRTFRPFSSLEGEFSIYYEEKRVKVGGRKADVLGRREKKEAFF